MLHYPLTADLEVHICCSMSDAALFSVTLNEVAAITAGYPLRVSAETLDAGDAAFVQLKNVNPDMGIEWDSVDRVELPSERRPRWLSPHDVIFAARGARNFAYSLTDAPELCVCAPHFFVLSIKHLENLHPEFLTWQINQRPAQDYFRKAAVGSQAVITIRRPAMEALPVVIPPMEEQLTIVEFARAARREHAALTQLIENNSQLSSAIAIGLHQRLRGTN